MRKMFTKRRTFILIGAIILALAVAYALLNRISQPIVTTTNPSDGSIEVLETSQIDISFDAKIQEGVKSKIAITTNPAFDFDSTWLVNTFKIIPKAPLQNNTRYSISVLFNNKEIYKFSFETATFSQADILKYGGLQSANDYVFGQATKKVVQQYPWYTNLPIKTKDYVIYYDFQQQKFAITFLTSKTPDEQNALVQEAVVKIQQIGVKPPIQYYINVPQP